MTVQIDTTAENNGVRFVTQGAHPSAPSSGHVLLYYVTGTANPGMFVEDSSGNKYGPLITGSPASSSANHGYFTYLAAQLEPLAGEFIQTGTFSYAIPSGTTKIALATYWTSVNSVARWEVRDPRFPVPLNGITATGLDSSSVGVFIDPSLPTYTDARTTYYDRLQTIYQTVPLALSLASASTAYTFLPGPYGSIITSLTIFDLTWIVARINGANTHSWNMTNEIGDTGSTDYQRIGEGGFFPVWKNSITRIVTGPERSAGAGKGSVTYFNCPASWGKVTDPTTYTFRDDFMTYPLNTSSNWTRTGATASNLEIQLTAGFANWCKILGDSNWGNYGLRSKTSVARSSQKQLIMDILPSTDNAMYGWNDGGGASYTNLAHAISFAGGPALVVWEAGVSRGTVGSGFTAGSIYRIRLTLDTPSANKCKYEIQGLPEYPPIGSTVWTNITPGTTSNSTTPLYAGIAAFGGPSYISDVKIV